MTASTTPQIRRADPADAAAVADIHLQSFAAAMPTIPPAHTDDQTRGWVRNILLPAGHTWVITEGDVVVGMLTVEADCIEHLYLDPLRRGTGLGDRLMAQAKHLAPEGLWLWAFQVNLPAIRFYQRHGFRETLRTDGSANDEKSPDVRMQWTPRPAPTAAGASEDAEASDDWAINRYPPGSGKAHTDSPIVARSQ